MDKEIRALVQLELLYFFRNNQSVLDTVSGISVRLGREQGDVEVAVKKFVKRGILKEKHIEDLTVYEYVENVDRKLQKKRIKGIKKEKVVESIEGL